MFVELPSVSDSERVGSVPGAGSGTRAGDNHSPEAKQPGGEAAPSPGEGGGTRGRRREGPGRRPGLSSGRSPAWVPGGMPGDLPFLPDKC